MTLSRSPDALWQLRLQMALLLACLAKRRGLQCCVARRTSAELDFIFSSATHQLLWLQAISSSAPEPLLTCHMCIKRTSFPEAKGPPKALSFLRYGDISKCVTSETLVFSCVQPFPPGGFLWVTSISLIQTNNSWDVAFELETNFKIKTSTFLLQFISLLALPYRESNEVHWRFPYSPWESS